MCTLSPVDFHGDTIFCIDYQNQPFTPAKPIVENLGLAWQAQAAKLTANKERWGITIIVIPSKSGDQQTLCLPVRKLPAYLASINPKKVRAELRPKIELYQAESDDALWTYWMEGRAERVEPVQNLHESSLPDPVTTITPSTPASRKPLRSLVHAWAQVSGTPHTALWPQVKAHFQLERIDDLPEEWLPDALEWVQGKIDSLPRALPAPSAFTQAPLLSLSADDLAALDKAAQRVEDLNAYVKKEINSVYMDILERIDPRRMHFPTWHVLSDYIHYALWRTVDLPSGSLKREGNPALAVKMLAGALGNR